MVILIVLGIVVFLIVIVLLTFRQSPADKRKQELLMEQIERDSEQRMAPLKWSLARLHAQAEIEENAPTLVKQLKEEIARNAPPLFDGPEPTQPTEPHYQHVPKRYYPSRGKDPSDAYSDGLDWAERRQKTEDENQAEKEAYERAYAEYEKDRSEYLQKKYGAEQRRREYYDNHPLRHHPALLEWDKHLKEQLGKWEQENPRPPKPNGS